MEALMNLLEKSKNIDTKQAFKSKGRNLRPIFKKSSPKTEAIDEQIYSQIQSLIKMDKQLTLKSSCQCKVCQRNGSHQQQQQETFIKHSSSYLNLFRLLTHLILIKPNQHEEILGELRIPLIFFRRNRQFQIGSPLRKLKSQQSFTRNSKFQNKEKEGLQGFLMFKSNEKTGALEFPQVVTSFQKVFNQIKTSVENTNKIENQKFQEELRVEETTRREKTSIYPHMIHQKLFESSVPSLFFDSTLDDSLRKNRKKPLNYIIHKNSKFLEQELQNHKIHPLQPFCIFRYEKENDQEDGHVQIEDKYQIFTMNAFQQHIQKHQLIFSPSTLKTNLDLTFIESFTKVKQMSVFSRSIFDALLSKFNPQQQMLSEKPKPTPSFYLSQYESKQEQPQKPQIFKLSKLQIMIKGKKISKFDRRHLDLYDLQALVKRTLDSAKSEEEKMYTLALYKTYKIINYLQEIVKIKVISLKLRWILNQYNQLVLGECLEYKIDELQTLFGEYRTRKQKVINNATDLLMAKSNDDNVKELVEIMSSNENQLRFEAMMRARKARITTEITTVQKDKQIKEIDRLQKIVRSLDLKEEERAKKKNVSEKKYQSGKKFKAECLFKTRINSEHSKIRACSLKKSVEELQRLSSLKKNEKGPKIRMKQKKYRLKPFKTQTSNLETHEDISS